MHRYGLLGLVIATLLGLFALQAEAASDARLQGPFDIKAKVVEGDTRDGPGTVLFRKYRFKPLCPDPVCESVQIAREGSTGQVGRTVLNRVGPGKYTGTEIQETPFCENGSPAESRTGEIAIRITRTAKGLATRIRGSLAFTTEGCTETFQRAKISGRRK